MRAVRPALLLLFGLAPSAALAQSGCVVADPSGTPLNLRDAPNGAILQTLRNGTQVTILRTTTLAGKPWALIANASGQQLGWVYRRYVNCAAAPPRAVRPREPAARPARPAPARVRRAPPEPAAAEPPPRPSKPIGSGAPSKSTDVAPPPR